MDFAPIPNDFKSLETGDVFRKCTLCSKDLLADGTQYLIEKAYQKKETIFEYAMCMDCYWEVRESLSLKSRTLIENYFDEHLDLDQRAETLLATKGRRTRSWLGHCMIKDTPRWKCEEYQICGFFHGKEIVFNGFPYMLSGEVIEDLIQLLSPETLGSLNDLTDKLFGIDLPKGFLLI